MAFEHQSQDRERFAKYGIMSYPKYELEPIIMKSLIRINFIRSVLGRKFTIYDYRQSIRALELNLEPKKDKEYMAAIKELNDKYNNGKIVSPEWKLKMLDEKAKILYLLLDRKFASHEISDSSPKI